MGLTSNLKWWLVYVHSKTLTGTSSPLSPQVINTMSDNDNLGVLSLKKVVCPVFDLKYGVHFSLLSLYVATALTSQGNGY